MKLASKAHHLRWDGSNSQTVAGCRHYPPKKKIVAIPSQATLVFLPNFQLVRVKLCFCMCHLGNELRNNEKMGIGVCFFTISWCSQLIGVFYHFTQLNFFVADTSWRLISPSNTAFTKVFVVVFLERWLSTSKNSDENLPTGWPVPIGWPSNLGVLGARPARWSISPTLW